MNYKLWRFTLVALILGTLWVCQSQGVNATLSITEKVERQLPVNNRTGCVYLDCESGCGDNGYCRIQGDTATCICNPGWQGDDCLTPTCDNCSHGTCTESGCSCDSGWAGENCDELICVPGVETCCTPDGICHCEGRECGPDDLPDLHFSINLIEPRIGDTLEFFEDCDCAVNEGCLRGPGARQLMRFNSWVLNTGKADLFIGVPSRTLHQFEYDTCHQHYHYLQFADFALKRDNDTVLHGFKQGFCLMDYTRNTAQNNRPDGYVEGARTELAYECDNQGLQVGWADWYPADLDCQWIDITNIEPGIYTFEMNINPERTIKESNYDNNLVTIEIELNCSNIICTAKDNCHLKGVCHDDTGCTHPEKYPGHTCDLETGECLDCDGPARPRPAPRPSTSPPSSPGASPSPRPTGPSPTGNTPETSSQSVNTPEVRAILCALLVALVLMM